MPRYSIFIDIDKCTGCHNCFLACRDEYYGNDYPGYSAAQPLNGQFWMQIKEVERGVYPKPKLDYIPIPCMQCQDAPCLDVALDGAVYRRDDGIVIIDPEKAKGQERIVNACPYRVIYWNQEKQVPQKCTFCAHRLDEGEKQPRCVEACPTGALMFGDLDDAGSDIAKAVAAADTEVFHPEYNTNPLVTYSGIPKRFITGEVVLKDKMDECAQGVKIVLEGNGQKLETASDVYGDFEFEGLPKNCTYQVTIEAKGYAKKQMEVSTQTDINLGEIILEP
jgi:Fe-S-cluster-containing dehydrogenase component